MMLAEHEQRVPHISSAAADEMWDSTNLNTSVVILNESGAERSEAWDESKDLHFLRSELNTNVQPYH